MCIPRVFFSCGMVPLPVTHITLLTPFPSQTKRTGTTGASRGMALYEEEVSPRSWTSPIHTPPTIPCAQTRYIPSIVEI